MQGETNGDIYCPYGSQQDTVSACDVTLDVLSDVVLAAIFPEGIPGAIAAGLTAASVGSIATAALCAIAPTVPPPFNWAWLSPFDVNSNWGEILAWVLESAYLYLWNQCCICSTPPEPGYTLLYNGTIPNSPDGLACFPNPDQSVGWQFKVVAIAEACLIGTVWTCLDFGRSTNPAGYMCPLTGTPTNSAVFTSLGWGNGGGGCDTTAYGSTDIQEYAMSAAESANDPLLFLHMHSNTIAFTPCSSIHWYLYGFPTGPITITTPIAPPTLIQPGPSAVPSGFTSTGTPTSGGVCNFAPISANGIEQRLVPQTRVADGSTDISGTGSWPLPSGTVGVTVDLTLYPEDFSHDAGDPPRLYQSGWVAWSIDGTEIVGGVHYLQSGILEIWNRPPTAGFLTYFVWPGFAASVQAWNTATPT